MTDSPQEASGEARAKAWQAALAKNVGGRVRHYRKLRNSMTAGRLSELLLEEWGVDMKRAVISNLEAGVRPTVSLAEIYALAYVLGVPPVMLAVPIGDESFEVLPGIRADPWLAARWVVGEAPPEWTSERTPADLAGDDELLLQYRAHDKLLGEWARAAARREREGVPEAAGGYEDPVGLVEDLIGSTRRTIRRMGATPPPLPAGLRHLDRAGEAERVPDA